jgi:hypothetical protein
MVPLLLEDVRYVEQGGLGMSKFWSGVVAASFVATVGLSGQEPVAPRGEVGTSGAQAPASQSSSGQSKSITVSGCIQNAPSATATATAPAGAGAAGAGGATASASSGAKFVLAMKPAAGAGGAVGTAGAAATQYQLDGEEKTISTHLNHQVEITGTLQSSASSGGGAAAGGAAGAGERSSAASASPTLKVESVKMVAATCS